MAERRASAVFPTVAPRRGHYESFYVRLVHPSEPLGAWIRYTVHKPPGGRARGSVWFVLFEAGSPPRASKVTLDEVSAPDGAYIAIGPSRFEPGRLTGEARTEQCDAAWDLRFEGAAPAFKHLPSDWMYRAKVPRTKTESPHPAATFDGRLTVDGREIPVDGWLGMMGHNWGAQHAERWVWMHGIGFEGHPDAWLDAAVGRIKAGPVTTPWIANGCLHLEGRDYRLGGLDRLRTTEIEAAPDHCEFMLSAGGIRVLGKLAAPREDFVGWVYADPDGGEHNTVNCSIARMDLTVDFTAEGRLVELHTDHGATYELGMRETDHGMPIQPFLDG